MAVDLQMLFSAFADRFAQIAQLVEQRTENPRVAGSIPALGIVLERVHLKCFWNFLCGCSSMVEH